MAWPPGLGKSTSIRAIIIKSSGKWLIFAPTHALLDEYEKDLMAAGHDCVHIYGFTESCWVLNNSPKSQDAGLIRRMHGVGVFPHLICEELGCACTDCKFREQWQETRGEGGVIQKTVLAPSNYVNFFEFTDFEGVVVEENNYGVSVPPLKFDTENVVENLNKMLHYVVSAKPRSHVQILNKKELKAVISAVKKKDHRTLRYYAYRADATIRDYNIHTIHQADNLNIKINQLCLIRMNHIVMYLDFYHRKQAYQEKEEKFKFDCAVDEAIRELSIIDSQLQIHSDDKWIVNNLKMQKQRMLDDVLRYADAVGIQNNCFKLDAEALDVLKFLKKLKQTRVRRKSSPTLDIKLEFQDSLFYQTLASHTPVMMADAELQFRPDFFKMDINLFKKLFPEFNVRVKMETCDTKALGRIILPSIHTGAHFKSFFNNTSNYDEIKKIDKHIQNKITYLKSKGRNPCVLTHMRFVKNGKLFGVPAYYFGSESGVNVYEHHSDLFVYGTFLMPESFYTSIWNRYYREAYGEMPSLKYELNETDRTWLPSNPQLRRIYDAFIMPKIYNLIHRVRMMRSETNVYFYGWNVPEPFKKQMPKILNGLHSLKLCDKNRDFKSKKI